MDQRTFLPRKPAKVVGIGFQATVSKQKRKGVPRAKLQNVRAHLRTITGISDLELFLVFVTVRDGLNSRQRLGKTLEPGDEEFKQFVITGISFESTKNIPLLPIDYAEEEYGIDEESQFNDEDEE